MEIGGKDFAERYKKHLMLPQIGEDGQRKLLQSRVLVIGAGGLGSPVILYLAAVGVGHLVVVDSDIVELSNLQRQILHFTKDLKRAKVLSAREKAVSLNPDVDVTIYQAYFDADNAQSLIDGCDVVVDCTDNAASKFFINDICVKIGVPLVHGGVSRFCGNVMTIIPGSATLRDLFASVGHQSHDAVNDGVFGAVPGVIGTIQAIEVVKLLLGMGESLVNQVLTFDALTMEFMKFNVNKPSR